VTAVELMPVHHFVRDRHLVERGLTNYWGYNTIGFFAPDPRYASEGVRGEQVREFKQMVKTLHQAGIEVILDVVYNHTAEGNQLGPTSASAASTTRPTTGWSPTTAATTWTTRDRQHAGHDAPRCVQLLMDSLRYWVSEMHVDGFRFDLASALARELHEVDRLSSFFDVIHQDPLISQVKLIAEPWDLGEGGYQVGNFPAGWAEWNGRYRDTLRRYWKGDGGQVADLAYRLTGSATSTSRAAAGRRPASTS
jgi:glycogen operon protein